MSKNGLRVRALLWLPTLALAPAFVGTGCGGNLFTSTSTAGAGGAGAGGAGAGGAAAGSGAVSGRGASAGQTSDGGSADGGSADGGSAGAVDTGGTSAGGKSVGGAAGSAGSVAGAGGSSPVVDSACPSNAPGGEACVTGLSCTYGDDLRARCRTRFKCVGAAWASTLAVCAPLISCDQVPEGFPKQGDACTTVGEDCTLANGAYGTVYCRCDACTGTQCAKTWECAGPPTGCPLLLPNDGQPCDTDGLSCMYGNCSMANGLQVACTKKVWNWSEVACPATSG